MFTHAHKHTHTMCIINCLKIEISIHNLIA